MVTLRADGLQGLRPTQRILSISGRAPKRCLKIRSTKGKPIGCFIRETFMSQADSDKFGLTSHQGIL